MKFNVLATISGVAVLVFGLLIAFGPRSIFSVCPIGVNASGCGGGCGSGTSETVEIESNDGCAGGDGCGSGSSGCNSGTSGCSSAGGIDLPRCHYSAQALLGIGILIAALGLCMIVFENILIHFGLSIGVFFSSIVVLFIANGLVGMCLAKNLSCRAVTLPAITVLGIILLAASAVYATYLYLKKPE